ncbi:hypothetical protein ACJ51O_35635 (plasmid) [Burkholderia pyrrocinia]|uniref:hypothetical protein n=1 Tax=Burkholderia pyrrocinia TaxID=60550 RepID=UPI0038B497DA
MNTEGILRERSRSSPELRAMAEAATMPEKTSRKTVWTSDINALARELKHVKNTIAEQGRKPGWAAKKPSELNGMLRECLCHVDAAFEKLGRSSYSHNPRKAKKLQEFKNEIASLHRQLWASAVKDLATERLVQRSPVETGWARWFVSGRREDRA